MSEQDNLTQLQLEDGTYQTRLTRNYLKRKPYEKQNPDIIKAVIPGLIDSIAKAIGGVVTPLDPLAKDYIANLEAVSQAISQGLR